MEEILTQYHDGVIIIKLDTNKPRSCLPFLISDTVVPEAIRLRKAIENEREKEKKARAGSEKRDPQLALFSSSGTQPFKFSRAPQQTTLQYLNILIWIFNVERPVQGNDRCHKFLNRYLT